MDKKRASEARKELRSELEALTGVASRIMDFREAVTPGRVTPISRVCGYPGCKCARGERHITQYLYVTRGGPLKRLYIPKKDYSGVFQRSERYGALRDARAELGRVYLRMLAAVDALEDALTEVYEKKTAKRLASHQTETTFSHQSVTTLAA